MKKPVPIFVVFILTIFNSYSQHNTYYIGHSGFGWDLIVGEMVNDLATDAGINTYDYGFQFIGGTCISNQWESHAQPQGGTDSHIELPSGNYNALVLAEQIPIEEVINSSNFGCNLTSYASVTNFYNMATDANPNTLVYLMEFHNEINVNSNDPYSDWVNLNAEMRPLWNQVADSVNRATNGPGIQIIPVAAAYQAMADSIRAGSFPGMTNWLEIFDPNDVSEATIHPTEMTYYLSACVHFAVFFNQSPVGLTNETFAAAGWQFDPPTVAQATMMQQIAWEVVNNQGNNITSIDEFINISNNKQLVVYPNPAVKKVTFEINNDQFKNAELKIFDLLGKEKMQILNGHGKKIIIDNINFPSGVYLYIIKDYNNTQIQGRIEVK